MPVVRQLPTEAHPDRGGAWQRSPALMLRRDTTFSPLCLTSCAGWFVVRGTDNSRRMRKALLCKQLEAHTSMLDRGSRARLIDFWNACVTSHSVMVCEFKVRPKISDNGASLFSVIEFLCS
jgi:hypothetical protein